MQATRICHILDIRYPIFQGGMLWLADAKLASAVSNAGGLGVISPYAGMKKNDDATHNLKTQIDYLKNLTNKPFGVNIPLDLEHSGLLIDCILQQNVKIVITAAGKPDIYTQLLKQAGVTVLHVVSSVSQARFAESCGVDGVIAEGSEAAAHNGRDELPLFSLIPQVVDAVSIPVIAAGGISDARGMVAAMSLGAEAIQMGTRFVAVKESPAHINYKQAILDAKDTDTVITCRKLLPTRSLRTVFSERLLALERSGASPEEIRQFLGYRRSYESQLKGHLDSGEIFAGTSSGMIKKISSVAQVFENLVKGYDEVVSTLLNSPKN